ncbi:hypothetical protein VTJ83DRAFT_2772 [Remersonia thermophila]|uniref:ferric-chelate reductase (NADPH) n=1 Tax=Remersonia thermophila TaxID=72144 RepID=A0ABR4DJQ9_9PEZI
MNHSHNHGTSRFSTLNQDLARRYWYTVAGFVGALCVIRGVNFYKARIRLRRRAARSVACPTKPSNQFLELWATLTAVIREISGPQLYVPLRGLSWLTPPPLGRVVVLLVYWIIIVYMMAIHVSVKDAFYWERIGYRNAWVTITQLPLLYLLATKCNVIGFLVGTSHERLNWLHRWVGRTMFVTATVHGWHFYTDWARADFVEYQLKMMPSIKYGLGAWAVLLWTMVAGLAPLRRVAYEVFVAQHILSAAFLLWLVYVHIPDSARYNVWFAIAALCLDRVCRVALLMGQNVQLFPDKSKCQGGRRIGHAAQLTAVGDSVAVITIKDVHFTWRAGQHLYLWLPSIGMAEAHPYTIACAHSLPETCVCNSIQLVVRKHRGFSRRLCEAASRPGGPKKVTAFISGPYGAPPCWDIYETVVLISASTGASFTLPILESLVQGSETNCVKRVEFLLVARQGEEVDFYVGRLHELIRRAKEVGIALGVLVAITRDPTATDGPATRIRACDGPSSSELSSSSPAGGAGQEKSAATALPAEVDVEHRRPRSAGRMSTESTDSHVVYLSTRPDVAALIRRAVEATTGETSVVVCGGPSLSSRVRNCVAALSDERAVHKGTGAQGIHLHVEEYSF